MTPLSHLNGATRKTIVSVLAIVMGAGLGLARWDETTTLIVGAVCAAFLGLCGVPFALWPDDNSRGDQPDAGSAQSADALNEAETRKTLHDFVCIGGGGGWSVVECARCGETGFGSGWFNQLRALVLPWWFRCRP